MLTLASSVSASVAVCRWGMYRKIEKARLSGSLVLLLLPKEAPSVGILLLVLGHVFPVLQPGPRLILTLQDAWPSGPYLHSPAWWWRNLTLVEFFWDPQKFFSWVCRLGPFQTRPIFICAMDFLSFSFWEILFLFLFFPFCVLTNFFFLPFC